MTLDEAIARYIAIPDDRKAWLLLRLSWWLTVYLRGCYDEADVDLLATKLKAANEIQHHLSSEAWSHLAGNPNRYPDEALIRICVETAAMYKVGGEFGGAMTSALVENLDKARPGIRPHESVSENQLDKFIRFTPYRQQSITGPDAEN
jgi:hypothetical protein